MISARDLPFLSDMTKTEVEGFWRGMAELQGRFYESPKTGHLIAVLIIGSDGDIDAQIITKELCGEHARAAELDAAVQDAILSATMPGLMDVLLLCGATHCVFCVPIKIIPVRLPDPGSPKN